MNADGKLIVKIIVGLVIWYFFMKGLTGHSPLEADPGDCGGIISRLC